MRRVLEPYQLQEARELKERGYSKREIAKRYGVGGTTIWENVFATKQKEPQAPQLPTYSKLKCVIFTVSLLRQQGYTSGVVAHSLQLPLIEVNRIYSKEGYGRM